MIFRASLDGLAKGITVSITLLFIVLIATQVHLFFTGEKAVALFVTVLLLIIYFGTFISRPLYYKITADSILVYRQYRKPVVISKQTIVKIKKVERAQIKKSIRHFGVGGLFGYFGNFLNARLGKMIWFVTNRNNLLLIETGTGQNIIISPNDPEAFLNAYTASKSFAKTATGGI